MNSANKNSPSTRVNAAPLLDIGRGNQPLKAEIMDSISQIIDSGRFIGGPFVEFLEQSVAEACDSKYAIGCASGSDALLLALMAIDLQPGDEVICPSFTFFATASAIHRLGGRPVFIDIEPGTFNIDPKQLVGAITPKTKAIIPVHLFGQCADMQPIMAIAAEHGLRVIEDCAQSIGATENGRSSGGIGDIGCFSFYPTKNLGGFGDGGMLTTNDDQLADRLRLLANHGMRPRYHHSVVGVNSRLDAIQAAALCAKMKHMEQYASQRLQNAANYHRLFEAAGLTSTIDLPVSRTDCGHVWNQYTIRIHSERNTAGNARDLVRAELAKRNIGSEVYYPIPLHQQDCFEYLNLPLGSLPQTETAAAQVLSIPIFPELKIAEQEYVVNSLAEVLATLEINTRPMAA